jgi:thiol-disulfide isomerase/thioredoxin
MKPRVDRRYLITLVMAISLGLAALVLGAQPSTFTPYAAPALAFTSYAGKTWATQDWRGRVVVVNFWASWCLPCLDELPMLNAAWVRYQAEGVLFFGAVLDDQPSAQRVLARLGISYPNGDGEAWRQRLKVSALPTTIIINAAGEVIASHVGRLDPAWLSAQLEAARQVRVP